MTEPLDMFSPVVGLIAFPSSIISFASLSRPGMVSYDLYYVHVFNMGLNPVNGSSK